MSRQLISTSHQTLEQAPDMSPDSSVCYHRTLTRDELAFRIEAVRDRLDTERREQFLAFGVPMECYWPASRVFHQQSNIGPATKFRLSIAEVDEFTRNLDYKRYPD